MLLEDSARSPVEIRRLGGDDAPAWRAVRLRSLRDHPENFGRTYEEFAAVPPPDLTTALAEIEDSEEDYIWGAFGPELIGMVRFRRDADARKRHKSHISQMYVVPERRGEGIGRRLLETALAVARSMPGLEKVSLSVGPHNLPARQLYVSLGFQSYGLERRSELVNGRFIDEEQMELWLYGEP